MLALPTDPNSGNDIFVWAIDHLWVPVSGAILGIWTHINGRFKKLDHGKLDKENFDLWSKNQEIQFEQHMNRMELINEQHRQAEIKLSDKLDDLKTLILERRTERRNEDK